MAKKLTDEQVVKIVQAEFETAMGKPGGDISAERAEAFEYYMRQPFGNEEPGSSKAVTSDVMEVVDGIMPSLLRIFTTQDNLVSFDAVGPEDEPMAEQESDYVSHMFFKKNPAFEIIFFWTFDALLQKNGYVKAYWNEYEETTTESYKGLSELELFDLLGDDELEPIEREERIGETTDEAGNIIEGTVYDIKFHRVRKRGFPAVENVPPEEFRISSDAKSVDPSRAGMVGHERYVKRSKLLEMGFDKEIVAALPAEQISLTSADKQARKNKSDDTDTGGGNPDDPSQDDILLREAYMPIDVDGDGRAELKQVFIANGEPLEINDSDRQPFHALCASPLPHKHFGTAPAEKVMEGQLISSTLLRQILDNLYHTNNPGHAVWEQGIGEGTMDALLTRRVGAVTPFARPIGESYAPMTVPFTAGASFPVLEYFEKKKRDKTGISADSEGLDPESLKHIQRSVLNTTQDTSKLKIELIARIFAETGFKTLFLHFHEMLQKHQQDAEIVKLRNEWHQVRPSEWRNRSDMTVNIGLGIGTRDQNLLHLDAIWEKQKQMVEGGGMNLTVTPKNLYNTAKEIVKNANLKQPEMFFTDPGDQKAPPPSTEQQALEAEKMKLEQRRQELDAARNQISQMKVQLDAQKQQTDAQLEMMKLEEKRQEREDKFAAENEKLRNELTALQVKMNAADADRSLQEERVAAEVGQLNASAMKLRAETAKIAEEVDAQAIENAATESGLKGLLESDDGGSEES